MKQSKAFKDRFLDSPECCGMASLFFVWMVLGATLSVFFMARTFNESMVDYGDDCAS